MIDLNNPAASDDQDEGASFAPWQQFLRRQWWPIAFGPLALLIGVAEPISRAHPHWLDFLPNWAVLPILILSVIWAAIVISYARYLKYRE